MIATQTAALFLDAYRDLNSRKLFWATLILSGIFVVVLAMVGVDDNSIVFFFKWHWEVPDPSLIYRQLILVFLMVGIWLSWGAVILALISTAGIFPDLIASGAIDLYLSKPISRIRLFITKYFASLMFVFLQISVFTIGCFFVVGWRLKEWRPSIFLAIPLITLLFSYIYSICVFLGIWLRSSIAALLFAILIWLFCGGLHQMNRSLWVGRRALEISIQSNEKDMAWIGAQKPSGSLFDFQTGLLRKRREADEERIADFRTKLRPIAFLHDLTSHVLDFAPKTAQTNDLLDRRLLTDDEITEEESSRSPGGAPVLGMQPTDVQAAAIEVKNALRHQSPLYIIGTSLATEAVVLGLAAWIFCRRDY